MILFKFYSEIVNFIIKLQHKFGIKIWCLPEIRLYPDISAPINLGLSYLVYKYSGLLPKILNLKNLKIFKNLKTLKSNPYIELLKVHLLRAVLDTWCYDLCRREERVGCV
jgi:hypothetical protein